MKKQIIACLLAALLLAGLGGCGQEAAQPPQSDPPQVEPQPDVPVEPEPDAPVEPDEPDTPVEPEQSEPPVAPEDDPTVSRTLYHGDEAAERLISVEVEVADDSPAALADGLRELGVLPADAQLLDCVFEEIGGEQTIVLDFDAAFARALQRTGTAGEWVTIGSVVDTFLTAWPDCTQVLLTVEGAALETGHNVYDAPLAWYEPEPEASMQLVVPTEDGEQVLAATRVHSELGVDISAVEDGFTCTDDANGLHIRSDATLESGAAAAYLAVTALELGQEEAVAGLLLQSGDENATCTEAYLDTLPAAHIRAEIPPYHTEYFVVTAAERTLLVELGYADEALDTLLPALVAMLNTATFPEP